MEPVDGGGGGGVSLQYNYCAGDYEVVSATYPMQLIIARLGSSETVYVHAAVHVSILIYHQLLLISQNNHVFTNVGCLASWWFCYPGFPLHHWLIVARSSSSNTEGECWVAAG